MVAFTTMLGLTLTPIELGSKNAQLLGGPM